MKPTLVTFDCHALRSRWYPYGASSSSDPNLIKIKSLLCFQNADDEADDAVCDPASRTDVVYLHLFAFAYVSRFPIFSFTQFNKYKLSAQLSLSFVISSTTQLSDQSSLCFVVKPRSHLLVYRCFSSGFKVNTTVQGFLDCLLHFSCIPSGSSSSNEADAPGIWNFVRFMPATFFFLN